MADRKPIKPQRKRALQNKAMNIEAKLKSESFYNYTQTSGDVTISAFTRVGIISLFTANDHELQKIWSAWYEETSDKFLTEVGEIKVQADTLRKRLPANFKMPQVQIPDNYVWKFSVTTPQTYQLTNLILKMDELMHDVESLWLLGQVDATELATARNQAIGSVKRLLNTIYTLTNAGKRTGGPYTTANFMKVFREQKSLPINKSDKKAMKKSLQSVDVADEQKISETSKEKSELKTELDEVKVTVAEVA
jgi:hypothetical protein